MTTVGNSPLGELVQQQVAVVENEIGSTTLLGELKQLAASPLEPRPDLIISSRVEGDGVLLLELHRLHSNRTFPALSVLSKHAAFVAAALDLPRAQSPETLLGEMIDRDIPHAQHRAQARSDLRAGRDFERRVLLLGNLHWGASPAAFSGEYPIVVWPNPREDHFGSLLVTGLTAEQRKEFVRLLVDSLDRGGIASVTEENAEEELDAELESEAEPLSHFREEPSALMDVKLPVVPQSVPRRVQVGQGAEDEQRFRELEAKLRAEGKIR